MKLISSCTAISLLAAPSALAQEAFTTTVNTAQAVQWPSQLPEYGYVVAGEGGTVYDILGPNAPAIYDADLNTWVVEGYDAPPNTKIELRGGVGMAEAFQNVAIASRGSPFPADSNGGPVNDLLQAITVASDQVAAQLCESSSRPKSITISLSAGFSLIFTGGTTANVVWDLNEICAEP